MKPTSFDTVQLYQAVEPFEPPLQEHVNQAQWGALQVGLATMPMVQNYSALQTYLPWGLWGAGVMLSLVTINILPNVAAAGAILSLGGVAMYYNSGEDYDLDF